MSAKPSPLSLDPPQLPPPNFPLRPMNTSHQTMIAPRSAVYFRPAALDMGLTFAVPFTSFCKDQSVLSEYLVRPFDLKEPIIAIDGTDRKGVQLFSNSIQQCLHEELGCRVRVFGEAPLPQPLNPALELPYFINSIRAWGEMMETIERASNSTQLAGSATEQLDRTYHTVSIVPRSPLMETSRAAARIPFTGTQSNDEHFRWLASHWAGHKRPEITISVQERDSIIRHRDVLIMPGVSSLTLVVIKGEDGGTDMISPKQLRRVLFEVKEWLRSG